MGEKTVFKANKVIADEVLEILLCRFLIAPQIRYDAEIYPQSFRLIENRAKIDTQREQNYKTSLVATYRKIF